MSGFATLDHIGIFLFTAGVGLIILAITWGGSTFPWSSPAVIASLAIGSCCMLLFGLLEYLLEPGRVLAKRFDRTVPMIPASLFREKDIGIICFISCSAGAAFYSIFYYISIYFTLVEQDSAAKAGLKLLYYVPGLAIGVFAARYCCNSWPRQTFWALFIGTIIETAGIAVVTAAIKKRDEVLVTVMMAFSGAGTGALFMPSNVHLAGMFPSSLSAAYSLVRFSLPFGGTVALTIMSSVFQNRLDQKFNLNSDGVQSATLRTITAADSAPDPRLNSTYARLPATQEAIRRQTSDAIMWAFVSIIPVLAVAVVLSAFLGNVWVPKNMHDNDVDVQRTRKQNPNVTDGGQDLTNISPTTQQVPAMEMIQVQEAITGDSPANVPRIIHSGYLLYLLRGLTKPEGLV
ncbi:uncharacterized protein PV07_07270 [Cladophialophora immunda]|uniref:Major facilitator superfamily (MFS) profile domain-containing protein n=1 Tax=Cladophialophora immunda TaxID=569365 RepID=A0A0D2CAV9_9EURO|nr:uncharacterized protein PV07_07270 [Cladophialophora immunda]KIW27540.1 hypothetical protein PV07_07270 [Cladophialophora immunda]